MFTRARVLLKADHGEGGPGWSDAAIAGALDVHRSTVQRVRRQFVVEGLAATLARKCPDRVYERVLDGRQEAYLVAFACLQPPGGHARWPLRLLAGELVRLEVVTTFFHQAGHRNISAAAVDWCSTTADACTKLKRRVEALQP